ncbi:MAG TPA: DoxX family protein [Myxococcota bacterium]|nr:DoxX family protein [Myxococcota bacterium]
MSQSHPSLILRAHRRMQRLGERLGWIPPLVARLSVGEMFMASGWGKMRNLPEFIAYFEQLNIPAAGLQAPVVATLELVCGALLMVGLGTRLVCLPLMGIMAVAVVTARRVDITSLDTLFYVVEYMYIVVLAWIATAGPGRAAIDSALLRRAERTQPTLTPVQRIMAA